MTLSTKTIAFGLLASVLTAGAVAHGAATPQIVEGKDRPILLGRMVVTAPALPAE